MEKVRTYRFPVESGGVYSQRKRISSVESVITLSVFEVKADESDEIWALIVFLEKSDVIVVFRVPQLGSSSNALKAAKVIKRTEFIAFLLFHVVDDKFSLFVADEVARFIASAQNMCDNIVDFYARVRRFVVHNLAK